jgi:methionine-rich copper-binding protein CopC
MSFAAAIAFAAPAHADVTLLSSTPADGTTVTAPTRIVLTFSEAPVTEGAGVDIEMTGMPGMAHHAPMKVMGFKTSIDGKLFLIDLPRALPVGTYSIAWHVTGKDSRRAEGRIGFGVK